MDVHNCGECYSIAPTSYQEEILPVSQSRFFVVGSQVIIGDKFRTQTGVLITEGGCFLRAIT